MSASTNDINKIELLVKQLGDVNLRIQERATDMLSTWDNSLVLPTITALLKDENVDKRRNAAKILSAIGNRTSVKPLIDALSDKDSRVRFLAAGALGMLGDIDAIPKLTDLSRNDKVQKVRETARKAIEDIRSVQHSSSIKRQIDDDLFRQKAEEIQKRIDDIRKRRLKVDKPHKKTTRPATKKMR